MEAHSYRHFSALAFGYCGVGGGLGRLFHVLKQFASEGVRLVFIGEWQGYYDAITLENDFLGKMEAVMTNTGQAVDCGYNTLPQASLRPHQITQGMTDVTIACSSVLVPGPNDYPFYYVHQHQGALGGGHHRRDPLPLGLVQPTQLQVNPQSIYPLLNPGSSTGH